MPAQGEQIVFERFVFTIMIADLKRINKVKVTLQKEVMEKK
jgi:Mg2+/Co2+ transporter CorC